VCIFESVWNNFSIVDAELRDNKVQDKSQSKLFRVRTRPEVIWHSLLKCARLSRLEFSVFHFSSGTLSLNLDSMFEAASYYYKRSPRLTYSELRFAEPRDEDRAKSYSMQYMLDASSV
jgi:hypothetical protein